VLLTHFVLPTLHLHCAGEDVDVVLCGIGPHVELNDPDSSLERLDDGKVAAVAAELVAGEVGVVARVDEVMRERLRHVVVHLRVRHGGRVQVGGEEEAVEVVEGEERARQARDVRDGAAALEVDLFQQAVNVRVLRAPLATADGVEVAAEDVGAHVRTPTGVEGEEGADVLRRRRILGVEAALEDEAELVRGAHFRLSPQVPALALAVESFFF
jgi:hypothetical protein